MLKNKEGVWTSVDMWNFKTNEDDDLVYIENTSRNKVLEITKGGQVLLKDYKEDKIEQLWKKSEPDQKGYFSLESSVPAKVITATSERGLEIKGDVIETNT